jgi:hypothetical protein
MVYLRHNLANRMALILLAIAVQLPHSRGEGAPEGSTDLLFDEIAPSLVLINCRLNGVEENGNGVIVKMDEKTYLLTNQHLLLGAEQINFITASGDRLAPRSVELSTSRDLVRLALEEGPGLLLSDQIKMNAPITILSGGNGKEQKFEHGKIIGVGGTMIEISAEFDESSNGAPALNAETKVVGIASYSRESSRHAMKKGTRFDESTRHFCYRVGNNGWKPVKWKTYNRKYGQAYRKHRAFADQVIAILKDRENFKASSKTAGELATQCSTHVRQLEMLTEQRDLTGFLLNEFEEHIELFEYAEKLFDNYAKSRR